LFSRGEHFVTLRIEITDFKCTGLGKEKQFDLVWTRGDVSKTILKAESHHSEETLFSGTIEVSLYM
jgi:hypothetical protein